MSRARDWSGRADDRDGRAGGRNGRVTRVVDRLRSRLWGPGDRGRAGKHVEPPSVTRPSIVGVLLLTVAYLGVFLHVTDVVGGSGLLVVEVAAVLASATAVAYWLDLRRAMLLSVVLLVGGLVAYYLSVPASQRALFSVGTVVRDSLALLTGLSVLRLLEAKVWVLAIVPAPLFASWVLAVRGRPSKSVAVGGAVLGFLVLTGDADVGTTLLGVVGATLGVGLGTLSVRGGLDAQWDTVALVVAAMVVVSASLTLVPGSAAQPLLFDDGTPTLESNLVGNADSVGILGSIRLSPKVRFTVQAEEPQYWRVGAYDRFTGGNWIRTGESSPYAGDLGEPPGPSRRLEQTVTAKTPLTALPAAWKPVRLGGDITRATQVTSLDGLRAGTPLRENESYTVVSQVPTYSEKDLRTAGTDYPEEVRERYLQLPASTPDRVRKRAAEVTTDANSPYEAAVAIERYLERNKEYSLSVERPEGNVADAFLFEMDAGYCVYFATTMVVMLRTQGVPARFVTGYTAGEQVAEDRWVVRGLDAHAWVEVYFPDVGWVRFDPTPRGARENAERVRLAEARESGENGVDTTESGAGEWTPTPGPDESTVSGFGTSTPAGGAVGPQAEQGRGLEQGTVPLSNSTLGTPGAVGENGAGDDGSGDGGFELPDRETAGYGLALLIGLVTGARRFGLLERGYRFVWLRYQPRHDPVTDTERAYDRLTYLLERRYRERRPGETPRDYLDSLYGVDPRAETVTALYERAHYGGTVTATEAEQAVAAVDALVGESTPILGRFRRALGRGA